jgi:hypothetical protein
MSRWKELGIRRFINNWWADERRSKDTNFSQSHICATLILAIAFSISAHAQSAKKPSSGGAVEKLIGTWHLVQIDAPGTDEQYVPIPQPKGTLIYSRDGHVSVQLMYQESAKSLSNRPRTR